MENHHLASASRLMSKDQYAFFPRASKRVRAVMPQSPPPCTRIHLPSSSHPLQIITFKSAQPAVNHPSPSKDTFLILVIPSGSASLPIPPAISTLFPFSYMLQLRDMVRKDIIELVLATDMKQVLLRPYTLNP